MMVLTDPGMRFPPSRIKFFVSGEPSAADLSRWRRAVLKRDDFTCQHCGLFSKQPGTLHVHHIVPYAEAPALRTEISNGITLCRACHVSEHERMERQKWTNWSKALRAACDRRLEELTRQERANKKPKRRAKKAKSHKAG
jgi:HNH endonuclease